MLSHPYFQIATLLKTDRLTLLTGLARFRFAIPFRVGKIMMSFDKIKDGKKVLTLIEERTTANNLLEFNHIVARAHQHNITHIAGIHAGGEFARWSLRVR